MVIQKKINEWRVTDEFDNHRVDYWLKKKVSYISYPIVCKLIRKGVLRVNGKRTKNSSILKTGDLIKFSRKVFANEEKDNAIKYNSRFANFVKGLVIFKDHYSIILNKPSGLAVQGGTKINLNIDMLLDSLKFKLPDRPKLVHRLDKQTSGILILARTLKAASYFGDLFRKRLIEKKYLAIVFGKPRYKYGKILISLKDEEKDKESITFYKCLETKKNLSLLLVKPVTGRKHQIRKHLFMIGNPIHGDTKFKNNAEEKKLKVSNFFLHAYSVSYNDENGFFKDFFAPLPEHFDFLLRSNNFTRSLINKNIDFKDLQNYKLIG
jgi:23S rRNA pseudouridine955/2504/2580 synthase